MEEREHNENNEQEKDEFLEAEFEVSNEELSDYLFTSLIGFGLAPTLEETDLVADLVFDWLFMKSLLSELKEDE